VAQVLAARKGRGRLVVPDFVAGEAFTKLRYDRRVSPRRDASIALTVFAMAASSPDLFEVRPAGDDHHDRAVELLGGYRDQGFSYVDALCFLTVDDDRSINRVLTVDGHDFSTYHFSHRVEVVTP